MTPDVWLAALWVAGFRSEGIGPIEEWHPMSGDEHQRRHNAFWSSLSCIIPDDEADEPYWMTEAASSHLLNNSI